jgi:hypothetical protein
MIPAFKVSSVLKMEPACHDQHEARPIIDQVASATKFRRKTAEVRALALFCHQVTSCRDVHREVLPSAMLLHRLTDIADQGITQASSRQ